MKKIVIVMLCMTVYPGFTSIPSLLTVQRSEAESIGSPYEQFFRHSQIGAEIPEIGEGFVPQGLAYLESFDWLLVSGYREDGRPSQLAVIERSEHRTLKMLSLYLADGLPYVGHAGGVAVSDEQIWISSQETVFGLDLNDVLHAVDNGMIVLTEQFRVDSRASFIAYHEGTLWVGEFAHGRKYSTNVSHRLLNSDRQIYKAFVSGFVVDRNTDGQTEPILSTVAGETVIPDLVLSIPDRIQGIAFTRDSIVLSQSYGRKNDSQLMFYANPLHRPEDGRVTMGKRAVPVWFLDRRFEQKRMSLPPMSEGIVNVRDQLDIVFESAALKYRAKLPLPNIYSFQYLDHPSDESSAKYVIMNPHK